MKKEVQFHETRHPVSRWIVLISLIFLPAGSTLLTPSSDTANRHESGCSCRQNITTSISAVNGPRGTLVNFPVFLNRRDANPKSGQVQPDRNAVRFTSSDGTPGLPHKTENFTHSTGNPVARVNFPDIPGTPGTTISKYCRSLAVSNQQNAEATFSHSNLLSGASDLRGVVDAGTAARKELS